MLAFTKKNDPVSTEEKWQLVGVILIYYSSFIVYLLYVSMVALIQAQTTQITSTCLSMFFKHNWTVSILAVHRSKFTQHLGDVAVVMQLNNTSR